VLAATSPSEAIQKAAEHAGKFQLLLSDVVMPEMQGFDLARKLRATYPHLHVLFMSGYTANVMPADVVGGETTSFLAKPFGAAELAAKVREVLDRPVVAAS
jgi:CheY-like chemotaxis protein